MNEWMNELLDQDQDLGFPLGKGQGKKGYLNVTIKATRLRNEALASEEATPLQQLQPEG